MTALIDDDVLSRGARRAEMALARGVPELLAGRFAPHATEALGADARLSQVKALPDNFFLRALPTIIQGEERVWCEALAYSADSAAANLEAIYAAAIARGANIAALAGAEMALLMTHAWAIVDAAHVVRELLQALRQGQNPMAAGFIERAFVANRMRNQMDHLHQNARNVGAAKGRPPIFGALTYVLSPRWDGDAQMWSGGGLVNLSTGTYPPGGGVKMRMPDLGGEWRPLAGLSLQAFGFEVELDALVVALVDVVSDFGARAERKIAEQIAKVAAERGIDEAKLWEHGPAGISMFIGFDAQTT